MTPVWITFALVAAIVLGSYWLFVVRPEGERQASIRKRLKPATERKRLRMLRAPERLSNIRVFDRILRRRDVFQRAQRAVAQSGLPITVGTLLLGSACAAAAAYVAVRELTGLAGVALLAAPIAGAIPIFVVKHARLRRIRRFEELFPEAITLIARALRAGHAFSTGVAMVAEEIPQPVGGEFKQLYEQQSYGLPLPEAMRQFAERVPLLDARFFVTAVLTQREAGGNLAEVLDNLANIMRERFKVKRQVRVISAHARISGWILAALPPALALYFLIAVPEHFTPVFTDPLGVRMVVIALGLQLFGVYVIRRIIDIEY